MKIAVIDCGTNTFNLGIAEISDNTFTYLYNDKIPVKLGEGGIDKNEISATAFQRGVDALIQHHHTIQNFDVSKIICFGTAALRDAKNNQAFIDTILQHTGIRIQLIDGNQEAEYIWNAVTACVKPEGNFLVMDIGGGSNEFIIGNTEQIIWKKSYRLGVSRLKEKFNIDDFNRVEQIQLLDQYLQTELADLYNECKKHNINFMIGSAGSFDTYANLESLQLSNRQFSPDQKSHVFDIGILLSNCTKIIGMNHEDLIHTPGIPDFRREFMVYSSVLIRKVLQQINIKRCGYSAWSLKEGMLLTAIK